MSDFGLRPGKRKAGPGPAMIIGMGVVVIVAAVLIGAVVMQGRQKEIRHAALWSVDGAPCPTLPASALPTLPNQPQTSFDYYDITFARAAGNVTCDQIKSNHGKGMRAVSACKFNSPEVLEVKTDKADVIYGPSIFHPVVIDVDQGQPSCTVIPVDRIKDMMAVN